MIILSIISCISLFGLVYYGSIKLWNCSLAIGGKVFSESGVVDFMLAASAATFYISTSFS